MMRHHGTRERAGTDEMLCALTSVEKPKGEQLLKVALHRALGQQLPVDSQLVQLCCPIDFGAGRVLHGQHVLCCVLPQHLWHLQAQAASVCILRNVTASVILWMASHALKEREQAKYGTRYLEACLYNNISEVQYLDPWAVCKVFPEPVCIFALQHVVDFLQETAKIEFSYNFSTITSPRQFFRPI